MKIIHTDNFGGDYPDEKFVEGLPPFANSEEGMKKAEEVCKAINNTTGEHCTRYWMVVEDGYKLKPGFEP